MICVFVVAWQEAKLKIARVITAMRPVGTFMREMIHADFEGRIPKVGRERGRKARGYVRARSRGLYARVPSHYCEARCRVRGRATWFVNVPVSSVAFNSPTKDA